MIEKVTADGKSPEEEIHSSKVMLTLALVPSAMLLVTVFYFALR